MKKVMVRAWEIAREGVQKFGGKVKEYFAVALKLAWKEFKAVVGNEFGFVALNGTEKQVKWAENIRKEAVEKIERVIKENEEWGNAKRGRAKAYARAVEIFEEMKNNGSAVFWIEQFGRINTYTEFTFAFERYIEKVEGNNTIVQKLHQFATTATKLDLEK
jgi:hypothetical protein